MSDDESENIGSEDSSEELSDEEEDYYIDEETGEKVRPSSIFKPGEEEAAAEFAQILAQLRRGRMRGMELPPPSPPAPPKKRARVVVPKEEEVEEEEEKPPKKRVRKPAPAPKK